EMSLPRWPTRPGERCHTGGPHSGSTSVGASSVSTAAAGQQERRLFQGTPPSSVRQVNTSQARKTRYVIRPIDNRATLSYFSAWSRNEGHPPAAPAGGGTLRCARHC